MTPKEFSQAAEMIEREFPSLWRKLYPRFYGDLVGNYLSLKVPAVVLAGTYMSFLMNGSRRDPGVDAGVFVTEITCQHNFPVYYIAKEFLQAVMHSDIPTSLRLADLKLPMPGATFMLPLGMLKHPEEGDVGFLSYAFHEKGELKGAVSGVIHTCTADTLICVTATHEQEVPPLFHMVVASGVDSALTVEGIDKTMKDHPFSYSKYFRDELEAPSDRPFNTTFMNLCIRILLAMSARPELVDRGKFTGKHLASQKLPIWTPNVVGRTYRIKRDEGHKGGGGWHTRMHWRRGHYRLQPYGPRSAPEYKTIWIEPSLISAE
jgi:hypothetical protein